MSIAMKKLRRLGCGLVCLIVLIGIMGFGFSIFKKVPSDAELASFFVQHKKDFVTLVSMLSSEPSEIVGITRHHVMLKEPWHQVSHQEANISTSRFDLYQKLMSKNDVQQVWRHDAETLIAAGFSGWGFASKGPRLAYVYRQDAPSNLVETLDGIKKHDSGWTTVYRRLANHWFIRLTL